MSIKGTHTLMEKIQLTNKLIETAKDYAELLKISPKMKCTFNKDVINEQLVVNEDYINDLVKQLQNKQ